VIVAVPPPAAENLLPPGSVPMPEGWSRRLGSSPIVNVHVVLDRPVLDQPFIAGVDTPAQWVFDRTSHSGLTSGQYLAVSLSAADDYVDTPTAALREKFLPELAALLPKMRAARVRDFFVTRERHATFRPAPGTAALRPASTTATPGLFLAGAYTATGWPATMEGAVRSGEAAASALLKLSGDSTIPSRCLRPRHEQSRVVRIAAYGASRNRHNVPPKKTKQILYADTTHNYSVASA